jgi:hypothetical protein
VKKWTGYLHSKVGVNETAFPVAKANSHPGVHDTTVYSSRDSGLAKGFRKHDR